MQSGLTTKGIGTIITGIFGNAFAEVLPLMFPNAPQWLITIIFALSILGMLFGLFLVWRGNKRANERLETTKERLKVSEKYIQKLATQITKQIREERGDKDVLPDKLLWLDAYLKSKVKRQNVKAETFVEVFTTAFSYRDFPQFILLLLTYSPLISHFHKLFSNIRLKTTLIMTAKLNIAFRRHQLGTLPIIETDGQYEQAYEDIIRLETGLPVDITVKIHRYLSFITLANCLRLLSPDRDYWKKLEFKPPLGYLNKTFVSSLSPLITLLDLATSSLRAEISEDLENYFMGGTKHDDIHKS